MPAKIREHRSFWEAHKWEVQADLQITVERVGEVAAAEVRALGVAPGMAVAENDFPVNPTKEL